MAFYLWQANALKASSAQSGSTSQRAQALRVARRLIAGQGLVTLAAAAAFWMLVGAASARAAVAGGLIAILPGIYFALRLFAGGPGATPRQMISALYRAETVKFVLTAVLFALAVPWFSEEFPALIVTFALALAMHWVAPFEVMSRESSNSP